MVVAAYGLILPQWVLDLPRLGCLNIHGSLLPRWRGAAPIHRAIEAGDADTGITIMQMDAGLDTGDMLLIEKDAIRPDDTTALLHDRLANLGGRMIVEALELAACGGLRATPQPAEGITYAHKIDKAEAAIDWTQPAAALARRVRKRLTLSPAAPLHWVSTPSNCGRPAWCLARHPGEVLHAKVTPWWWPAAEQALAYTPCSAQVASASPHATSCTPQANTRLATRRLNRERKARRLELSGPSPHLPGHRAWPVVWRTVIFSGSGGPHHVQHVENCRPDGGHHRPVHGHWRPDRGAQRHDAGPGRGPGHELLQLLVFGPDGAQDVQRARGRCPDCAALLRHGAELAQRANLPMPRVPDRRSGPNAFATGRNPEHAAVAATTGIIDVLVSANCAA